MAENVAPGTGFANVAGGIGGIMGSLFGNDGAGNDIAAVISASKGNVNAGTYPTAETMSASTRNSGMLYIVGGIVLIVVMILVLKK